MKKVLASLLAGVGVLAAGLGSTACLWIVFDEPEIPKSMIK